MNLNNRDKEAKENGKIHHYDQERAKMLSKLEQSDLLVYEDDRYFVLNKPYDIQIDGYRPCTLLSLLRRFRTYPPPVHFCNQLDYATSGLILLAKDSFAARAAHNLFENRKVQKRYQALVWGHVVQEQYIDHPLDVHSSHTQVSLEGKDSLSYVQPMAQGYYDGKEASLVELRPHTGRRHQLRVHLTSLGHGIIGDVTYGCSERYPRMMLHAFMLQLPEPVSLSVSISVPFGVETIGV